MKIRSFSSILLLLLWLNGCAGSDGSDQSAESDSVDTVSTDTESVDTSTDTDSYLDNGCSDVVPPYEHPPWQPYEDMPECQHVAVVKDCTDGWCRIPKGCFVMGSPPDQYGRPPLKEEQLTVILDQDFEILQFEVTRKQWRQLGFEIPEPYSLPGDLTTCEEDNCPINTVSWWAAVQFANAMSIRDGLEPCYVIGGCTGEIFEQAYDCTEVSTTAPTLYECEGYRLPTEAEWEYAARAGTQTGSYLGPVEAPDYEPIAYHDLCHCQRYLEGAAWYCYDSKDHPHPVGLKTPNQWGLYDVLGNVSEWANDYGNVLLPEGPVHNLGAVLKPVPDVAYSRATRGLHFYNLPSASLGTRSGEIPGSAALPGYGLRLVRTLPE